MIFFDRLNKSLALFERWLLVFIVMVMVLLAFAQVILRNVFDEGILWGDTFLRHLVLWVGFIGASLATKEEKHININVFGRIVKPAFRNSSQIVINLCSFLVAGYLSYAAWKFVAEERAFGTTLFADLPAWIFQIIIPVGFALMSFRFFLLFLEKLVLTFKRGEQQ